MATKLEIEKKGDEILIVIEEIFIFSNSSHLEWRAGLSDTILKGTHQDHPCQVWFNLVQRFQRRRFKCDLLSKYA
jgi:hypothetical protein